LRAGTPQLIVPFAWDQFDNGARISALGVGQAIPATRLTARKLERQLGAMLSSAAIRARCAEVAQRFTGTDAAEVLCDRIEEWLAAEPS
jgi:rhamnosyltransferase subunit B